MLADIIKEMGFVELDASELEQPISVTDRGSVATVGDLIEEKAPAGIRAMFGLVSAHVGEHVQPVAKLDPNELRRVATEMLQKSDPAHRVAAIGLGDYSTKELIDEVARGTAMGERILDAVRLNGVLVEKAVASGKIRPRAKRDPYGNLRIPDFDF
jgi:hypothetical protein